MFKNIILAVTIFMLSLSLVASIGIHGYKVYNKVKNHEYRAITERQKVLCDCVVVEKYLQDKGTGI